MRFAYADPPYPGCEKFYEGSRSVNHPILINTLSAEYPDGWALSTNVPNLKYVLSLCPEDVRICAWVKPFASFKKNVPRAWTWEPIIVRGGRALTIEDRTVRDHISCSITLRRGFVGAKPDGVCFWMFEFLGMQPNDDFHDIFPGSGAVGRAWELWRSGGPLFRAVDLPEVAR